MRDCSEYIKRNEILSELDYFYLNQMYNIKPINKNQDYDINAYIEIINNIENKDLQKRIFTLMLMNYYSITVFAGGDSLNIQNEISNFINLTNKYELDIDLFKKHANFDLLLKVNLEYKNMDLLCFLEKYYPNELTKENIEKVSDLSIYRSLSQNIEQSKRVIDLNLIEIYHLDTNYYNNALDVIAKYKPTQKNIINETESFKFLYSLGCDFNYENSNKYYKELYNDINSSYLNLKENKKNLNELLENIPTMIQACVKRNINNDNLLNKTTNIDEYLKQTQELINKYKDQIILGELKESFLIHNQNLENNNIKLEFNNNEN